MNKTDTRGNRQMGHHEMERIEEEEGVRHTTVLDWKQPLTHWNKNRKTWLDHLGKKIILAADPVETKMSCINCIEKTCFLLFFLPDIKAVQTFYVLDQLALPIMFVFAEHQNFFLNNFLYVRQHYTHFRAVQMIVRMQNIHLVDLEFTRWLKVEYASIHTVMYKYEHRGNVQASVFRKE